MSEKNSHKETIPIDLSSALERIGGDESFLQELINIYIDDFLDKHGQLRKAIEQEDFVSIKEIGHSLKGSSGNLSLNRLQETSYGIELAGREKDIERAKLFFDRLNRDFEKLKEHLPLEQKKSPEHQREPDNRVNHLQILAADDSIPSQTLLKSLAAQAGLDIDLANNGRKAVDFFREKRYDIIFLDIHMPEMDGFEALNKIRQIEHENVLPRTPIIALTGATFQEEGTTCLEAGFDDFVEKSFHQETLPDIISKHVHTSKRTTENINLDQSIRPLIPEYLKDRELDVEKIRKALEKQDFPQIEDLGHRMKGSGKCYGFEQISALGHRIELSAKERKSQDIERSLSQIKDYLTTLLQK